VPQKYAELSEKKYGWSPRWLIAQIKIKINNRTTTSEIIKRHPPKKEIYIKF